MGCGCGKSKYADMGTGAAAETSSVAASAVGASKIKVHIGPLEVGADGMAVKPQFNLGIQGGSLYAMAGVRDVRDGIAAESLAMYMKSYSSSGTTLVELLENVKANEKVPALDDLVVAAPQIVAEVMSATGADIGAENVAEVEGAVYIYVGAGVTAGAYLGWLDTQGYRMIGVEGKVATAASMAITLKAGIHEEKQAVRVVSYLTNVGFDVIVKLKKPVDNGEKPSQ
eukprot:TRINITY_DN91536_c0_g1_i1.p1 TRINITY_DN91536_c0_g1~~TRINITY_DN91536_c0_g1_i1.p1  ORF type:complete len:263 (+),score=52.12 TRINITY_DN91536_c0_g1_i1:111-791(+)